MKKVSWIIGLPIIAFAVTACGGGSGEPAGSGSTPPAGAMGGSGGSSSSSSSSAGSSSSNPGTTRGTLVQNPPAPVGSFSAADLLNQLGISEVGAELLQLALSPVCTVNTYHMEYNTVGGQNEPATASGALMIPSGTAAGCQGPFPIVVYAHGTSPDKSFNLADITASNATEGLLMAAVFGSQGYIVVAPNYAGYDTSNLAYHPYLNADQQSKDMIDAVTAAKTALGAINVQQNGKLFVTGYSQGGFVAMATHRALQQAGMSVTASVPMSGPYALAAFGDAVFQGQVNGGAVENVVLITTSYQHSYGHMYSAEAFEAAYASSIDELLPSTQSVPSLVAQGLLPDALFSSDPPAPQYASITPATQPAALAPAFALGFGSPNLLTNSYRLQFLQDSLAQPDGGFPTVTTLVPAANPMLDLRQDLKTNDLRNWVPAAPLLMCAGSGDPTVFYFNTDLMQQYWAQNAPAGAPISVLDVDSPVTDGDPYADEKNGFAAAKGLLQLSEGTDAVLEAYHATLVPPFCLYAAKSFFDAH